MINAILNWFRSKPIAEPEVQPVTRIDTRTGLSQPLPIIEVKCTDCGGEEFMAGPEGGMCQNVLCTNCKQWFNVCVGFGRVLSFEKLEGKRG